jgi:hypothetical protein
MVAKSGNFASRERCSGVWPRRRVEPPRDIGSVPILNETLRKTLKELANYPRGERGSTQNLFRAIAYMGLMRLFSMQPDADAAAIAQAIEEAADYIRKEREPEFRPRKSVSVTVSFPVETELALSASVILTGEEAKSAERKLEEAYYRIHWQRLSKGGAWLLGVYNEAGELADVSAADDPQDALLAVAERLLPS